MNFLLFVLIAFAASWILFAVHLSTQPPQPSKIARLKQHRAASKAKKEDPKPQAMKVTEQQTVKEASAFIKPSVMTIIMSIVAGVGVYYITKWPVMGLMIFISVQLMPYMSAKNSPRSRSAAAAETIEKMTDNIMNFMQAGTSMQEALKQALSTPSVEFRKSADRVRKAFETNFSSGLASLKEEVPHSMTDLLAATLEFIRNSTASGNTSESLEMVKVASESTVRLEKRLLVSQSAGYSTAKIVMMMSFGLMIMMRRLGGETYEVYSTLLGQMILLGFGLFIFGSVYAVLAITRGKKLLRISIKEDLLSEDFDDDFYEE